MRRCSCRLSETILAGAGPLSDVTGGARERPSCLIWGFLRVVPRMSEADGEVLIFEEKVSNWTFSFNASQELDLRKDIWLAVSLEFFCAK